MQICIIGAGHVGGALGMGWARAGHTVVFGVRDPSAEKVKMLLDSIGPNASATQVEPASRVGEVIALATPWEPTETIVKSLGDLGGKLLIDTTNAVLPDLSGLAFGADTSAGEQVAGWAANARVVKAFNTIGFNIMANPVFPEGPATLLYCGDDATAKQTVQKLAADLGFAPVDAGPLTQARLLESLAMLWISLAYQQGLGREFTFRMARREEPK